MEYSTQRSIRIVAGLLLAVVATQVVYTSLYMASMDIPRQVLWGLEGVVFAYLAAYAGAVTVASGTQALAWSAITASAALNVVQVGIGVTLFEPFREAAQALDTLTPVAGAIVAFSFFIYNAAKILLGFAAMNFGLAALAAGHKVLGATAALLGMVAMTSNAALLILGREGLIPPPVAGASGVLATAVLAICLWREQTDR